MKLKLLMIFAVVIATISCSGLPLKPEVNSCLIVQNENLIFCVNNQTSQEHEFDLVIGDQINALLDRGTWHSNEDWGKVLTYIRLLEDALPRKIRKRMNLYKLNLKEIDK